eukprot:scaffold190630_cov31-Tisochrysis_lutea.AAC.3
MAPKLHPYAALCLWRAILTRVPRPPPYMQAKAVAWNQWRIFYRASVPESQRPHLASTREGKRKTINIGVHLAGTPVPAPMVGGGLAVLRPWGLIWAFCPPQCLSSTC